MVSHERPSPKKMTADKRFWLWSTKAGDISIAVGSTLLSYTMEARVLKSVRRKAKPTDAACRQQAGGKPTAAGAVAITMEMECAQVLTSLLQSWRDASESNVQNILVSLALVIRSQHYLDENEARQQQQLTTKQIQKGLCSILQRHYASYKKEGRYEAFEAKFSLLMETIPMTFSKGESEAAIATTAFVDAEEEGVHVLITILQTVLERHPTLFLTTLKSSSQTGRIHTMDSMIWKT